MRRFTTRFRRLTILLSALLLLTLATILPASAQTTDGIGTLLASGAGFARIEGGGQVVVRKGFGQLYISNATTINTTGRGQREVLPDGTVHLWGWNGDVTIRGTALTVRVEGACALRADGQGSAWLKGRGSFNANGLRGRWSAEGKAVTFTP